MDARKKLGEKVNSPGPGPILQKLVFTTEALCSYRENLGRKPVIGTKYVVVEHEGNDQEDWTMEGSL